MTDREQIHAHAVRLLHALCAKHFPERSPVKPLPTITGVIDQIDNLTTALTMSDKTLRKRIEYVRWQLSMFDYLLPGKWLPEPPMRRNWFGRLVPVNITQDMIVWAGEIARRRVLMDLDSLLEQPK